jgi:hypothetical protein
MTSAAPAAARPESRRPAGVGTGLVVAVVWLLVLGVLVTIVGRCVSAAGVPELGVVDQWSRVDEATHGVAAWELLVAVLVAALLARSVRERASIRAALVIALVDAVAIVAGALVGIVGVLQRKIDTPMTTDYYGTVERVGEILGFLAVAAAGVAVAAFVATARSSGRSDEVEDPGPAAVAG